MKRTTTLILLTLFFAVSIVLALHISTPKKANHKHTGFDRTFAPKVLQPLDTLDIKYNSYYIAGTKDEKIYLGNSTAPLHLLSVNTISKDTQHIRLNIEDLENLKFRSVNVKVTPPYFYMMDGTMPGIFRGKIGEWHADHFLPKIPYFVDAAPINGSSFVVRSFNSDTHKYELGTLTDSTPYLKLAPNVLEKQIDGLFCVDGMLHYDKELNKIVYLYYYRNQYIVADTDLNIVNHGNTIDTISRAKIKVAEITSENSMTLSSPPLLVNKRSCVYRNWLFVNSNLMAKNEKEKIFDHTSVIDVYNIQNEEYLFSFYLPHFKKKKMNEFIMIVNDQLITLYDKYIVIYHINKEYFHFNNMNEFNNFSQHKDKLFYRPVKTGD